MGVGYNFVCMSCKKYYELGYGSYRTWIYATTIKDYENVSSEDKTLCKNMNLEKCLRTHNGHAFELLNMDYVVLEEGKLLEENPSPYNPTPDRLIADISGYQKISDDELFGLIEEK